MPPWNHQNNPATEDTSSSHVYFVYRLTSNLHGNTNGLVISSNAGHAISIFCRLHGTTPNRVTVICHYPLQTM